MKRLNNSGATFLAAIFAMLILASFGVVFTSFFANETSTSINLMQSIQAFFLSDAGVEFTIQQLSIIGQFDTFGTSPVSVSLGQGSFTVQTFTTDIGGSPLPSTRKRIRSTGTVGNATRLIDTTIEQQ